MTHLNNNDLGIQPIAAGDGEFVTTPTWCVQSLRDLNEAVRRGRRAGDAWQVRNEAERAADNAALAARADEATAAKAVRIEKDCYRNAWENT